MGSPFDAFIDASWTERATGLAATNRARLRDGMVGAGFQGLAQEWWHFEWPDKKGGDAAPARCDVPYSSQEPDGEVVVA
jgi:D-alanyl-D-alanine dipeptidase